MVQAVLIKTFFSQRPRFSHLPVVLMWLALMAVSSSVSWKNPKLLRGGATVELAIFEEGEVWRLFTAQFLHSDLGHLLSNSYMMFILGLFVSAYFGWWVFPVAALLGGALTHLFTIMAYSPGAHLLGASGVVYWLAGFWLVLYLLIERQRSWPRRLLRVTGVGLLILFPSEFQPQVSYAAHAWGCVLGIAFGLVYFSFKRHWIRSFEQYEWESSEEEVESPGVTFH